MAAGDWLKNVNKPNYKNRSDYGVRVARPGFNAQTCAQNQLLFNSGWAILQIAAVIDFTGASTIEIIQKQTVIQKVNKHTYDIEETTTIEVVDSVPAGISGTAYHDNLTDFSAFSINRKYVRKDTGDGTRYYTNPTYEEDDDYFTTTMITYIKKELYQKRHGQDYTPFFLAGSAVFGGNSNQAIIFTVDIETDVDYPYTEEALPLISAGGDYGIKSESIFGENVPGLCSNMFSKLVQAVKTTDTSTFNGLVFWSPMDKWNADASGVLLPFEFYGFTGDGDKKQDGGQYYTRYAPTFISDASPSGAEYKDAYVAGLIGQSGVSNGVLVVLRSPMVSPEYEEI